MKVSILSMKELRSELDELRTRNPKFDGDDLFLLWFLKAYVTDNEDLASDAVVGCPNDKGVDGVLIDERVRTAFVIQVKYRQTLSDKNEKRSDVMSFAELAGIIADEDDKSFKQAMATADPNVANRLKDVRRRVLKDGYRLWFYYVTLGKCSRELDADARHCVCHACHSADLEIFDGRRLMILLRDYLDGVAPPIPTLDLEIEQGKFVKVNGILQRFDCKTEIESWVFSMRGDSVALLFESTGPRLFARNIRGFMGRSTHVNESMERTLKDEPERFFYYNNGITIVCDKAVKQSGQGRDILRVSNPQVINGQQTTRMLALQDEHSSNASVLMKVIQVPKEPYGEDDFDALVSNIVAGTNWQNAISPSDLRSNDRRQIEIERAFRKLGYMYLRKREAKSETRSKAGGNRFWHVKKDEIAQAVAGCNLDPVIVRSGKENLFDEKYYDIVFPNSNPNYYLTRYRLLREVSWNSYGYSERGYAKWLVLNFVWQRLNPYLRSEKSCEVFRSGCETASRNLVNPLNECIYLVFQAALKYYRSKRGKGAKAVDISTFFRNKKGRDIEFQNFWNGHNNPHKRRFAKYWRRVVRALSEDKK